MTQVSSGSRWISEGWVQAGLILWGGGRRWQSSVTLKLSLSSQAGLTPDAVEGAGGSADWDFGPGGSDPILGGFTEPNSLQSLQEACISSQSMMPPSYSLRI